MVVLQCTSLLLLVVPLPLPETVSTRQQAKGDLPKTQQASRVLELDPNPTGQNCHLGLGSYTGKIYCAMLAD